MDNTQRGSVICSYKRRIDGAILFVKVPATIIRSECLGDARSTTPNLSQSYRLTAACIISTAQQAKPKVNGHSEPALAQLIKVKVLDTSHSTFMYFRYYFRSDLLTNVVYPAGLLTP